MEHMGFGLNERGGKNKNKKDEFTQAIQALSIILLTLSPYMAQLPNTKSRH